MINLKNTFEKNIGKIFSGILKDSESTIKKGLLLYPSTRPIDKALEYSSNPFIPGVTGSYKGVMELLRDSGIENENGKFKALYELNNEEMKKLITAVVLRYSKNLDIEKIIGNLFLIKVLSLLVGLFFHLNKSLQVLKVFLLENLYDNDANNDPCL